MISLILRDGLLVKYLKCRGSPARFTVKKGNVTYIFRWHLSRARFSLFEVSLRIYVIRSNGSGCLDVQTGSEVGLAYDWRGAKAESLRTTETNRFL